MSNGKIPNSFRYSTETLEGFSKASLANAFDLIAESEILLNAKCLSRAYFIAVAAIEEIGKSFIAYDSQGRDLNDSAVTSKIRTSLESHSKKLNSAFLASVMSHNDIRNELTNFIDLIITLKNGREPSMYTDIDYSSGEIKTPREVISPRAATDCVRLAKHCYHKNIEHQKTKRPAVWSSSEDHFFAMKDGKVNDLFNNEDFWWFHIANLEAGKPNVAESIVTYQREYLNKEKKFKEVTTEK